jgi:hypothetical protein
LILWEWQHLIVRLQQTPQTGQCAFAGVGIEHVGDGNISMSELPAGRVYPMGRADLAAKFLAQRMQRFVVFDAILPEPHEGKTH